MPKKATYEELERRLNLLEKENQKISDTEKMYKTIVEKSKEAILIHDMGGKGEMM